MFSKHHERSFADLSINLREESEWLVGGLRSFEYLLDVVSLAIEPLAGLLACGTASGAIHIFGRPGVEVKLAVPNSIRVKFLHFAPSVCSLVCVDGNDQLHIWDLTAVGRPKRVSSTNFPQAVNCLTVSPSHTHAFLSLQSGDIKTFDLLCLQKSPYTIPNLWRLYKGKISGAKTSTALNLADSTPIDLVIHPRDLNLVFIAYEGGVILSDLTQRNTVRVYTLEPPKGRGVDVATYGQLSVTAIAIHPTGHLFAIGYTDGSVAFWAVDDDSKPLLVKTIDLQSVDVVKETHPSNIDKNHTSRLDSSREPIFRLSWSSFSTASSSETALTILGGLTSGQTGITIEWIPAINPAVPSAIPADVLVWDDMRKSLTSSRISHLSSKGIVQDFLLIPSNSPHFSGSFDPIAILLLCEFDGGTRSIEAYQFPPSSKAFVRPLHDASTSPATPASPLQPPGKYADPQHLLLPNPLLNGVDGITNGQLINFDRDSYEQLAHESTTDTNEIQLKGGRAWADEWSPNERSAIKYQSPRLVVTTHYNLTVRFQDISAHLLKPDSPSVEKTFPNLLPDLTIDVTDVLVDPRVSAQIPNLILHQARIDSVHLSRESFECAIVLQTGHAVIYRLCSELRENIPQKELSDKELINLEHVPFRGGRRYSPFLMIDAGKGCMTAFASSDIGFLAAAYGNGFLFIVDLRGPRILLRRGQDTKPNSKETRGLHLRNHSGHLDPIGSLTWTISAIGTESRLRVLLIAVHDSGLTEIFTVSRPSGLDVWVIESECVTTHTVPNPLPGSTFVLDGKTGAKRKADRAGLRLSLQPSSATSNVPSVLVVVGATRGKCIANINGEKIGKTDWDVKMGSVLSVEVVEKMGSHVLVVFTDKSKALVYSLPSLTHLHTLELPPSNQLISVDETGDFIGWSRHSASGLVKQMTYASLFAIRRKYTPPNIDLEGMKLSIPPQPQPISASTAAYVTSWLGLGKSMTGEQLDLLLAGPDRPVPPPQSQEKVASSSGASSALGMPSAAAVTGLYDRLSSALSERGQVLDGLEDRFNSLEEGSRGMLAQAKRLAMEQQAKGWLGL